MTSSEVSHFRKYFYPLILVLTALVICIANYTPGTWLSGWDNLHPEMNFGVYWNRILHSVWQEHQGLGAVATQAHASEIPRVIILQILDVIFPTHFLRWAYAFLMLIIGPLGIYFFVNELFGNDPKKRVFSFIGALYFLLNWGTLQHFFVPLEMFLTLYGYIGWLFLFLFKYLHTGKVKDYAIFSGITFLAMPMAHTPTLWFTYFLFVGIVCLMYLALNRSWKSVQKGLFVFISNICVNAFWLFPTIYFAINHADDVAAAKITRLFSEEAILHNQEYANFVDIPVIKGYLFNWLVFNEHTYQPIFFEWLKYASQNVGVMTLGYILYAFVVLGVAYALISRNKNFIYFVLIFFLSTFFLLMDSPPFGFAFEFLQDNIPLFKEAIRLPFTKFSIQLMMSYSIFLSFGSFAAFKGLAFIFNYFKVERFELGNVIRYVMGATLSVFIIFFSLPMITGNLIGKIERVNFPKEYFEAFDYLNTKNDVRIATLPAHFMYGWLYFDWIDNDLVDASYQGAGFTWFLSKNPILEREFDRWFPYNETFYNEYQYALYSRDGNIFKNVLDKYQVNYIFYDKSITIPYSEKTLFYEETDKFLASQKYLVLDKQYGSISIYKYTGLDENRGFVYAPEKFTVSSSKTSFSNIDKLGSNIIDEYYLEGEASSAYPFADDKNLELDNSGNLKISLPKGFDKYPNIALNLGSYRNDNVLPATIELNSGMMSINYIYPEFISSMGQNLLTDATYTQYISVAEGSDLLLNSDFVEAEGFATPVYLNKRNNLLMFESNANESDYIGEKVYSAEVSDCAGGDGEYGKEFGIYPDSVIIKSLNKNACLGFGNEIVNSEPVVYEVSFEYRNTSGSRALYCLSERGSTECKNEKYINAPYSSESFAKYVDYVYLPDSLDTELNLIIETLDKQKEQQVEFKNVYIHKHKVLSNTTFSIDTAALNITAHTVPVTINDFPITVDLSKFKEFDYSYPAGDKSFNSIAQNCDGRGYDTFSRVLETHNGRKNYLYKATDAISCDAIETKDLNLGAGYIFSFDSENIAHKGLDICVLDRDTNKCLINDRLNGNGKQSFILPPYTPGGDLAINIGNQSIGEKSSENRLYSVEAKYLPYKLLKGININSGVNEIVNPIKVVSAKKLSVDKYLINIEAFNPLVSGKIYEKGVFTLNQAYEKGWKAYDANSCIMGIKSSLTCKELADSTHVIAKSWSNGWVIPAKDNTILLIFAPQKLQTLGNTLFLGFILAILTVLSVFSYHKWATRS